MGLHYENAAPQWWQRRTLSAEAPNSHSFEMRSPSTRTLSKRSASWWWSNRRGLHHQKTFVQ